MNAEATTAPVDLEMPLECGGCGYDLRGADDRCPECGRRFDRAQLLDARVPWEQRKYAGRISAYLRTLYLATSRPWLLAEKVTMPVSYQSGKTFRRITWFVAFVPILVIALWTRSGIAPGRDSEAISVLFANRFSFTAGLAGLGCGLWCMMSATTLPFFMARISMQRRGRAIALSCYACAPMALASSIILAIAGISFGCASLVFRGHFSILVLHEFAHWPWPAAAFLALFFLPSLNSVLWILRGSTGCGLIRLIVVSILLPIGWILMLILMPVIFLLVCALGISFVRSFS